MPYLLLLLALAVGVAGVALLVLDKRRTAADPASADPASSASDAPVSHEPAELAGAAEPNAELVTEPVIESEAAADATDTQASAERPAPEAESDAPAEAEPQPEPQVEQTEQEEQEETASAPEASALEREAEQPEREAEHEPEREPEREPNRSYHSFLPGSQRRERRAWAEKRGFEFSKQDSYLVDEWMRGAAAQGAAPKDIVAGNAHGHEMLLMDLAGIQVMAMRTGAASDIVVDFRREEQPVDNPSEDLVRVMSLEGFDIFATDAGVGQRLVDERVVVALAQMPAAVTALWMESEWVLAQMSKDARTPQWEALLAPLAKLADAARVLPPRSSATQMWRIEDVDPAREIPAPPRPEPTGPTPVPDHFEFDRPSIQRPEAPVEMPSRTRSDVRGAVDHSALGADEVDAIADGRERPQPEAGHARLPRRGDKGSSIFGDD
ncbi:hypothetical protein [Corynebacterium sp.]|uniref:hypothetical protein n=1 Tax=Corynebacterium sp. TaxID=1720 RepID=UPI0026DD2474|nr:hypothetical protein [Corynebacterium sp.]MDO5032741.1 hypothetical protein [Corynebacterium sp.]